MKKHFTLLFCLSLLLLTSCNNQNQSPGGQVNINEEQTLKITSKLEQQAETATRTSLDDAYSQMKTKIDELTAGKNARLGKVSGGNVKNDCKATSWSFTYFNDIAGDKNNLDENTVAWTGKKGVVSGYEKLFSMGLDTADYDYIRKDVGDLWKNCADIVNKVYSDTTDPNVWGFQININWNTKISPDAPVWMVSPGAGQKVRYFNSQTGKEIKTL